MPLSEWPRQCMAPECGCQGAVRTLHETDSDRLGGRSVHPGPESETLLELLVQWEELRRQGKTATPEELCPDDARLQALLRERLARRQRLHAALDLPAVTGHEQVARPVALPVIEGYEIGGVVRRGGLGPGFQGPPTALQRGGAPQIVGSAAPPRPDGPGP